MAKPPITKDTKLCISVAERPGNFGTALMNAAFEKKSLDFVYKACKVKPGKLKQAIEGVRALNIRGCGVSMPFKLEAMELVDSLDPWAKQIGAINTIVNTNGHLKGYNTDAHGGYQILRTVTLKGKSVVMAGSGGVARALCAGLKKAGATDVTLVSKDLKEARVLAQNWGFEVASWGSHEKMSADLFVNATPVGMKPKPNASPLTRKGVENYRAIMDVVIYPNETRLREFAQAAKKKTLSGVDMSVQQSMKQFELYTGHKAPKQLMKNLITKVK